MVSQQKIYADFRHLLHTLESNQDKVPAEILLLLSTLKQDLGKYAPTDVSAPTGATSPTEIPAPTGANSSADVLAPVAATASPPDGADVANLSHEISEFLQSSVSDHKDLSHEISKFLVSVEKSLSQSSDFSLYESYIARKHAQVEDKPAAPYYIPLDSPQGLTALERQYTALPPRRKKTESRHHHPPARPMRAYRLIIGLAIASCCLAFCYKLYEQQRANLYPDTTALPPNRTLPASATKHTDNPPPQDTERATSTPVVAENETAAAGLQKFLAGDASSGEELFSLLKSCWQNKSCKGADIVVLGTLYERYGQSPQVCAMIVLIMQQLQCRAAEEWIERWAQQNHLNQLDVAEQLLALGGEDAKALLLLLLQKQVNAQHSVRLMRILLPRYAQDRQVRDALIAKFQRANDSSLQSTILSLLATMNNVELSFFISVVASEEYGLTLRLNALDTIVFYVNTQKRVSGQVTYLICELNEASAYSSDEVLRQKISEVIQQLAGK